MHLTLMILAYCYSVGDDRFFNQIIELNNFSNYVCTFWVIFDTIICIPYNT